MGCAVLTCAIPFGMCGTNTGYAEAIPYGMCGTVLRYSLWDVRCGTNKGGAQAAGTEPAAAINARASPEGTLSLPPLPASPPFLPAAPPFPARVPDHVPLTLRRDHGVQTRRPCPATLATPRDPARQPCT
eukprot:3773095-Rhodomonas_salina.1